jgi:DNA helicase-2/ATP-dependent DNA helicase PcrA
VNQQERELELKRLEMVLRYIRIKLQEGTEKLRGARAELQEALADYWDNSGMDYWGLSQFTAAVERQRSLAMASYLRCSQYEKMAASPYFGRIDFAEQGPEGFGITEPVYIGIHTLATQETGEFLVYDWRSPIAGMFYDYERGRAQYLCPTGTITGRITLKRQYKIIDGRMEYMFDSDVKIDDQMLQEILGKSADDKMRTIINTIQRDQNRAIRDERHRILLVQGTAGSGKTSIALHRAAYLLYRERETITARNILIFSPNRIFSNYISNVLPELGEENVLQTTFRDYVYRSKLRLPGEVEDWTAQLEYLLTGVADQEYHIRVAGMKYKSLGFIDVLRNYLSFLAADLVRDYPDIEFKGRIIFSREEWELLFFDHLAYLPVAERLKQIRQRILVKLRPLINELRQAKEQEIVASAEEVNEKTIKALARLSARRELDVLLAEIGRMTLLDPFLLYRRLFEDQALFRNLAEEAEVPDDWAAICEQTLAWFDSGRISYQDSILLLCFQGCLAGFPIKNEIRHVIVDEAQDYTLLQFKILRHLFPKSAWTILRDPDQSVYPYLPVAGLEEMVQVLNEPLFGMESSLDMKDSTTEENSLIIRLVRSYRSTQEIQAFCRALLPNAEPIEHIRRSGSRPQVIQAGTPGLTSEDEYTKAIANEVRKLREEGRQSIAVICKTAFETVEAYEALKSKIDLSLITWEIDEFQKGTVVIPVYLAKGLEFDAVLVYDAGTQVYSREEERNLLYVACTRALHRLSLYYRGDLSPFVAAINTELYKMENN